MIQAFAKINLRLEIEKKLENGFHYLHMINSRISLCDDIYIEPSEVNIISFSLASLNQTSNNIVKNVVEYMQDSFNIEERISIYIKKRIPVGSGLGGGSSDASAILLWFNDHYKLGLSINELERIGLKFGADIPYCLHKKTSYVYGIGENIIELDIKPFEAYLICPNINISTKEIFDSNTIYGNKLSLEEVNMLIRKKPEEIFKNDFLNQVLAKYPEVDYIYKALEKYGYISLSGTGPSLIFIPYKDINVTEIMKELNNCMIYNIYIKE